MDKAFPPPMEEKTASKKTPPPTKAKNPLPIIARFNLQYYLDNSSRLIADTERQQANLTDTIAQTDDRELRGIFLAQMKGLAERKRGFEAERAKLETERAALEADGVVDHRDFRRSDADLLLVEARDHLAAGDDAIGAQREQPLHQRVSSRFLLVDVLLGGQHERHTGRECRQPPVDAGRDQKRVNHVRAFVLEQSDEPQKRSGVARARLACHELDRHAGRRDLVGDLAAPGQRHDAGLHAN